MLPHRYVQVFILQLRHQNVVVVEEVELALVLVDATVDAKGLIHPQKKLAGINTYAIWMKRSISSR